MPRSFLTQAICAAVVAALPAMLSGCNKPPEVGPPPPPGSHERPSDTARAPATMRAAETAAATRVADAAADFAITQLEEDVANGNLSKAREDLAKLQSKEVYDTLSQEKKDEVDTYAKSLPAKGQIPPAPSMPKM